MPRAHPINRGKCVVQFADAVIEMPIALFGAAEIEAQSLITRSHKRARQGMRNLVMHGATVLRMRMADDGTALQCTFARAVDDRFKATDRPVDEELF